MNTQTQLQEFASDASDVCSHISVREDENGPYIFALGLKQMHTLQLRKVGDKYVVQLWLGPDWETETLVSEPAFETAEQAFEVATKWLQLDSR